MKKILPSKILPSICVLALALASTTSFNAISQTAEQTVKRHISEKTYSPYVSQHFPQRVYWGDTHLHTNYSMDAYPAGNTTLSPNDAYRYAKGESVNSAKLGIPSKLQRPLDFLVVTDHAEYFGMLRKILTGDAELMKNPDAKRWYDIAKSGKEIAAAMEIIGTIPKADEKVKNPALKKSLWAESTRIADNNNEPGKFTAFIGYEWTSMPNKGNNLHRVVIFKDGADKANQMIPFSAFDSEDPEKLWQWLQGYEDQTGGSVLAIPHNGNVSNGLMFAETNFEQQPLTPDYAKARARWEPLYEVTQMKGDGETHPKLSPDDGFADFETWDKGNLVANTAKEESMLEFEYARSALKNGLKLEKSLGVNPFKFGMIGSTDSHTSLSTADSNNFFGKASHLEPSPKRNSATLMKGKAFAWSAEETSASGYAGIWATENTREALFDAMMRRETYATTGPRITVRFFGGWDYQHDDINRPNYAEIGYSKGVPMGSDLSNSVGDNTGNKSPNFLIVATKDSVGANLDRIQVVKGWLDNDQQVQEKVYNVSVSNQRKIIDNKVEKLVSTVDVKNATYTNSIGATSLATVWTDPDFNAQQAAFYYVRILEIPTPRWTVYDAKRFSTELPENTPLEIQERAYTSPIWFTPK